MPPGLNLELVVDSNGRIITVNENMIEFLYDWLSLGWSNHSITDYHPGVIRSCS